MRMPENIQNENITPSLAEFIQSRKRVIEEIEQGVAYWATHMEDVAFVARSIAIALELPSDTVEQVYKGGLLHDMGKSAAEMHSILMHPGKLTEAQWQIVKRHPVLGVEVIQTIFGINDPIILDIAKQHHEKLDVSGYPNGLKGDEIAVPVRIVTVADICCSITRDRPTAPARSREVAVFNLRQEADKGELDSIIVETLAVNVFGLPARSAT